MTAQSFEVGRLCKPIGVDSHAVMDIFVRDTKLTLSTYHLKQGFAYGGSCLPKEVRKVTYMAGKLGVELPLMSALERSNDSHIAEAVRLVKATGARRVAVLGLAFKPGPTTCAKARSSMSWLSCWTPGSRSRRMSLQSVPKPGSTRNWPMSPMLRKGWGNSRKACTTCSKPKS